MAVAPLLILDVPTLQKSLRLGSLLSSDQGFAVLEDGMRFARIALVDGLGEGAITYLVGLPRQQNPVTNLEVLRAKAEQCELNLVLLYLVKHLPMAFLDAGGGMLDFYNKEAPYRLSNTDAREILKRETEDQINTAMQALSLRLRGAQNSCEATMGTAICAHTLDALPSTVQAPLLEATLDNRYLNANRASMLGLPGLLR